MAKENTFSLTLLNEPTTLDPQRLSSASGNYLTTLLFRGLYRWDSSSKLKPDEGECRRKGKELYCRIFKTARWSNSEAVTSADYLRAFQFLIDPKNSAPQAQLLFSVKNAKSIYEGKSKPDQFGFKIIDKNNFVIEFSEADSEFLYKLVHPALYPRHSTTTKNHPADSTLVSNGFFQLKEHVKNQKFVLERSSSISDSKTYVSKVEALIIDSDNTALQLFEAGKIQLLRRLPAEEFSRFKNTEFFKQFPVLRFDYIGFGPQLKPFPSLRKRLAHEFDPKSFQTLFQTEGKPGCPPLPSSFYEGDTCYKPGSSSETPQWPHKIKPILGYSQMGGEDIRRAAEWFQGQWKSRLNVNIELQSREQGVYLNWLRTNPPALFRKGLSLDRPTCLAALENFSKGNPENFIQFENEEFEDILRKLSSLSLSSGERKKLCSAGIRLLIQDAHIIPLGEIKFTILVNPQYKGWSLNSLNQLDLRHLTISSTTKAPAISK